MEQKWWRRWPYRCRLPAKHWLVSIHSLLLDSSITETPKHVDDSKMATLLFSCNHGDTSSHVFELVALSFGLRAATVQHVVRNRSTRIRFVSLDSIRLFWSRFSFSETWFVWHKRWISTNRSHWQAEGLHFEQQPFDRMEEGTGTSDRLPHPSQSRTCSFALKSEWGYLNLVKTSL